MNKSFWIPLLCGLIFCTQAVAAEDTDHQASPALLAYVDGVLRTHPRVMAAQSMVEAANARERSAARPLYNPELEAEFEDSDSRTRSIGISQTFDLGNKRAAREAVASFERQAEVEEFRLVQQRVSAELLTALGEYQVTAELSRIANERKALMARFRALATERREAGDLNQVEGQLAELAYAEAALLAAQTASEQVNAEQDLTRITGSVVASPPSLPSRYVGVTVTEASIQSTLNALPSIRAAQARIAASQATLRLRQRERRPDPTIGLFAGREGKDDLVGVRFSIPLPVRNGYRAEVDAAGAEADAVRLSVDGEYRSLRAELVGASKRYELSRAAWIDWLQVGAGSLDGQIQVLEQLWRAGELSTAEYLVQLEQSLDTQMAAIEQRGILWADWIAWLAVSGEIDAWLRLKESP